MINFPSSPTLGQEFVSGTEAWVWDGVKWIAAGIVPSPSAVFSNTNRIINGDMAIDQRNSGASNTVAGYTVDRWSIGFGGLTGKLRYQQQGASSGGALASLGFGYALTLTSLSAYTPVATDSMRLMQPIEADMISDFCWGTANAQPVTLSFLVNSSVAKTFSGVLANASPGTRSYAFTYAIPAASVWTKISITIPGDTAGTWTMQGNGAGLWVEFDLGCGTNFQTAAGTWANGDFRCATGAAKFVSTNAATLQITAVKLEIGSVATPFNRQSLAKSTLDCQRYYQNGQAFLATYASAAGQAVSYGFMAPVTLRLPGPWAVTIASTSNVNWTLAGFNYNSAGNFNVSGTAIAAGPVTITVQFNTGPTAEM